MHGSTHCAAARGLTARLPTILVKRAGLKRHVLLVLLGGVHLLRRRPGEAPPALHVEGRGDKAEKWARAAAAAQMKKRGE